MGVYFGETEITNIDNLVPQAGQDITQAFFGSTEVFTVWGEYDGTLPAQYSANGGYLADYRIYGSAGGVGDYVAPEYKQVHTDTVTIDGIVWDILGYDHDTVYKSDNTLAQHSVTIQAHDVLSDMQFDTKEALFAFDNGLAAGTYHFTVGAQPWYASDIGKTIQFTLTQAIPAGGQLVINNNYNVTMVGATISAFASGTATTATETVTMSEGNDGTDLGTVSNGLSQDGIINSIQRSFLGYGNWEKSAIRQYLNSSVSVGSVWEPKHKWDRPPTWAANTAGFLNGLSADFIANLGTTSKTTALNRVTDGGGAGTTLDKVFLLSRSELYAGDETTGGEGAAYSYYSDFSDLSAPGVGEDSNRIKYRDGSAVYWWSRSPYVGNAINVFSVLTTGALNGNFNATNSFGVAPACCIVLDDIDTNDWLREKFLKNPRTAFSYEVDMSVSDGTTSTTTPIYIGFFPLNAYEYIDYASGKIYRRTDNWLSVPEIREQTLYEATVTVSDDGEYTITLSDTMSRNIVLTFEIEPFILPDGKAWTIASWAENVSDKVSVLVGDSGGGATSYLNEGYTAFEAGWEPYDPQQMVDRIEVHIDSGLTARTCKFRIMMTDSEIPSQTYEPYVAPVDPPVPLPALPTVDGTTITDYAGQSAAVPSRFTAKYRKQNF